MNVDRETVTVTGATGGAGVATASARTTQVVEGMITGVYIEYLGSPPATTDITIQEANLSPAITVLTVSDANTDGWFAPDKATVNSDTMAVYTGDHLIVTIAQANDGDGAKVTIQWVK